MAPNTTYEFVKVDREGPVTIVTLNRPEVMNALHRPAHFELGQVFDEFAADPSLWVAIVTGAGNKAFSAGNDLKHQAAGGELGTPPSGFAGLTSRFDLTKPVIAAVNGVAMGGGFEIALACDLIIAAETAVFALPEPKVVLAALALDRGLQSGFVQAPHDRLLGRADRHRTAFRDQACPAFGGRHQLAGRDHFVDEAEVEALASGDAAAGEDHAHRALQADLARQPVQAAGKRREANARLG